MFTGSANPEKWTVAGMPDLTGQTWLVTGATRGLGLFTARTAAQHGAHVVLAVRNTQLGQQIAHELGNVSVVELELSDLAHVRRAAQHVSEQIGEIDVLINNAGGSTTHRQETADGFEWHLGVNALAPLLFSNLILDQVRGRVVIVTSITHWLARFDFADPHYRSRRWSQGRAYAQSKLAELWWAKELARQLDEQGRGVQVQCAHPGWANTAMGNPARTKIGSALVRALAGRIANPTELSGLTTLFAATQQLPQCSFVGPDGLDGLHGYPTLVRRSPAAADADLARKFWDFAAQEIC